MRGYTCVAGSAGALHMHCCRCCCSIMSSPMCRYHRKTQKGGRAPSCVLLGRDCRGLLQARLCVWRAGRAMWAVMRERRAGTIRRRNNSSALPAESRKQLAGLAYTAGSKQAAGGASCAWHHPTFSCFHVLLQYRYSAQPMQQMPPAVTCAPCVRVAHDTHTLTISMPDAHARSSSSSVLAWHSSWMPSEFNMAACNTQPSNTPPPGVTHYILPPRDTTKTHTKNAPSSMICLL